MKPFTLSIIFCFTAISYTQFVSYKSYEYNPTNVDLFFYEKTTMTFSHGVERYEHATGTNLAHCRSRCAQEQPKCRNVVIIIHGANQENIECRFYNVDGTVHYNQNSVLQLISIHMFTDKPFMRPSGYCQELDYMNLCGSCSCHDMYSQSKTPFYCDCTKAVGVKLHCKEVLDLNPKAVSGLYEIKPDDGDKFTVYCRFSDDGKAMVRFIRRVDKDKNRLTEDIDNLTDDMEYYEYNQKALMNDSMLGLHYAQRLTSGYEMALWVEYVRWDGVFGQTKYENFKLTNGREYRMQFTNEPDDGSHMLSVKGGEFKNQGGRIHWWTSHWNSYKVVIYQILRRLGFESYLRVHGNIKGKDQHVIFYLLHE